MGVLSNLIIATTGKLPAELSNIKKWVEAHGGRYSGEVKEGVTHLIASKDAWKKVADPVLKANNLDIPIVTYDWLEDSLQRKRKLAEKKYTFETLKKDKKRSRELKKLGVQVDGKKFMDGCKISKELTGSGTSNKLPTVRKPKPSKSIFFADVINTPYVSATDDLKRRRAEREAAEAAAKADRAAKAARKTGLLQAGTEQCPIDLENGMSANLAHSSIAAKPSLSASSESLSSRSKLSTPLKSPALSSTKPQAKKQNLKDLYHYYLDSTGFEYKVTLARSDYALNSIARYQLSILESHTIPHTYCTFVQYKPPSGSPPSSASETTTAEGTHWRNDLLAFLKQGNIENPAKSSPTNVRTYANYVGALPPELSDAEAEAARLNSLVSPPTPSTNTPYKALLCPMSSSFDLAWRAFRHVFRDITLLSWEERFDTNQTTQKARARALNVEPFMYAKPTKGLPLGLQVQLPGLYQGSGGSIAEGSGDTVILHDAENGYVRNEFRLPGLDEALSTKGAVGVAIARDDEAFKKKEEERRETEREKERKARGEVKKVKKANFNKPLFNCATGRPQTDVWGKYLPSSGGGSMGSSGRTPMRHWGYDKE